jgi:tetratricopeptide (TPR) repeat protein
MAAAAAGDRKLRLEGGGNLHRAARACGARRYVQQSSGFFLRPGDGLADESEGMAVDASPRVAASARTYAELEARVLNSGEMEGLALRYGFFYGPNTWYRAEGAAADQARRREIPIIGQGEGVWSWLHINDAARAIADFTEAIRLDPQHPSPYNDRGFCRLQQGQPDEAIADFTRAIALAPHFAKALKNRGDAYLVKRDSDRAVRDLSEAIRLEPDNADSYASRAAAYRAQGKVKEAAADERSAKELGK